MTDTNARNMWQGVKYPLTPTERKQRSRDRRHMRTIELPPEAFEAIEALRCDDDTSLGATVTRLVVKLYEAQARRNERAEF